MTIMLTQWLCRLRHAAYAIPWDSRKQAAAEIEAAGRDLIGSVLNDRCGICGQPIAPEHRTTAFPTMDDALKGLAESARDQVLTRRTLDRLGLTVEKLP
jgi:hypothetical protein